MVKERVTGVVAGIGLKWAPLKTRLDKSERGKHQLVSKPERSGVK